MALNEQFQLTADFFYKLTFLVNPSESSVGITELVNGQLYEYFAWKYLGCRESNHAEFDFFPRLLHWLALNKGSCTGINVEMIDSIADVLRDSDPFYDIVHAQLIDYLLKSAVEDVTISTITDEIEKFDDFNETRDTPFDVEDALTIWIGKVLGDGTTSSLRHQLNSQRNRILDFYNLSSFQSMQSLSEEGVSQLPSNLLTVLASLLFKEAVMKVSFMNHSPIHEDNPDPTEVVNDYEQIVLLDEYVQQESTQNAFEAAVPEKSFDVVSESESDANSEVDFEDFIDIYAESGSACGVKEVVNETDLTGDLSDKNILDDYVYQDEDEVQTIDDGVIQFTLKAVDETSVAEPSHEPTEIDEPSPLQETKRFVKNVVGTTSHVNPENSDVYEKKKTALLSKLQSRLANATKADRLKTTKLCINNGKGNYQVIKNALKQIMKGKAFEPTLKGALKSLDEYHQTSKDEHYVIVMKGVNNQVYRGLFVLKRQQDCENRLVKLHTMMPPHPEEIVESTITACFKYQTSSKSFQQIPTKQLSFAVHAICV